MPAPQDHAHGQPSWKGLVRWGNVSLQTVHLGVGGALFVGLWVLLARYWGVGDFGTFNYIYAYAALWGIVFDFGLDVLITRFTAAGSQRIAAWLLPLKTLVLSAGLLAASGIGALLLPGNGTTLTILLAGVALFSCTNFINGTLRGLERLDIEARIGLSQKAGFFAAAVFGVTVLDAGMTWVAACYALSQAGGFTATFVAARKLGIGIDIADASLRGRRPLLREVGWIWLVALATFLGLRLDLFLLMQILGEEAVGIYSAGFRIVEGFMLLGIAFMTALFPRLAAEAARGGSQRSILKRAGLLMASAGMAAAVANALAAPSLMPLLFGQGFTESVPILVALGFALPVAYAALLLGQASMARAEAGIFAKSLGAGLAANAAVSLAGIALFGIMGAVAGFIVREVVTAALLVKATLRREESTS